MGLGPHADGGKSEQIIRILDSCYSHIRTSAVLHRPGDIQHPVPRFEVCVVVTGAELQELKHQIQLLSDPSSPESVGRLLQLRRQVLLLQFDTAVRHLARSVIIGRSSSW